MADIYQSVTKVMADMDAIGKTKFNQQGNFKYRGIDDVMNALNPAMVKNKIFVVPEVLEQTREDRVTNKGGNIIYSILKIKYTFYAEDGSHIDSIVIGEAFDSGDKATNKAMSVAFKYACFQVFCIPTEEMKDPDADKYELGDKSEDQHKNEMEEIANQKINDIKLKTIHKEMERTGITEKTICGVYKITTISDITEGMYPNVMDTFKNTKSKEN
ncbi:MAG: hypothetical protein K0S04_304 [Herbinix sp.]|jgi:hypothetical protein|nr:hypothetical protein [Herbinix sp.]